MNSSSRVARYSQGLAAALLLLCGVERSPANPPPAASGSTAPSEAQPLAPQGSFFSSLRQGFAQDWEHEVVRGHFDVGAGPEGHRYYCLVNPKKGKNEEYGVAGELVPHRDGSSGIKDVAVTQYRCADAEQKGLLVTSGYVVGGKPVAKSAQALPVQPAPTAAAPVTSAAAPVVPPAPVVPIAPVAPLAASAGTDESTQAEVMAAYTRFIAGQNAHDRAAVSEFLLDSKNFVWAQLGGGSVWGRQEALDAFEREWKGTWILDLQTKELRIASPAPGVAVLIAPLLYTQGPPGKTPSTVSIRWGGVFVKTPAGWRIASIFITPFQGWRSASGD